MKKAIGYFEGEKLYLTIASYVNNNRIYLGLETKDGELYADITINLFDRMIPSKNYIFINSDLSDKLKKFLINKDIIDEPIITLPYNMGRYDLSKVNMNKIKEYDKIGFERYNKELNNEENIEI